MPPRRGRGGATRRTTEESRADSEDDVQQVENVTRQIGSRNSILPPPMLKKLSLISVQESRNQYFCDPQWFRDIASHGPTTCVTPKPHFQTSPSDQGKAPNNIASLSSRSTTIGKSRVARDPITMHTSRRSNSDIACVTSIGYPRTKASDESSTTKYRLLHASGPHPIPPPNDPN
ncbi:hypothetical protein F511_19079 [Dorcoceras hygrometricum]|uniref:Uncharacterized protein n=1 Tax=Dorcoceras hygrometricum TaxID=472368 RepID=A0A2Z7D0Q7_9LAMI|nr:hypothetical protein F511_19079 [Dorcoceras hygrometricum]